MTASLIGELISEFIDGLFDELMIDSLQERIKGLPIYLSKPAEAAIVGLKLIKVKDVRLAKLVRIEIVRRQKVEKYF